MTAATAAATMTARATSTALRYVPVDLVDAAWADGAQVLERACDRSDGETTAEQLRASIKAGELLLLGHSGGWAAVKVQSYAAKRVLHVEAIHAPGLTTAPLFEQLKAFALHNRCSAIQGACGPAVARLWQRKFGFKEAYKIMRYAI